MPGAQDCEPTRPKREGAFARPLAISLEHAVRMREQLRQFLRDNHPEEMALLDAYEGVIDAYSGASTDLEISQTGEAIDYSAIRAGSDAVAKFLAANGRTPRRTVLREVINLGWARGNPNARRLLREAIKYHLSSAAKGRKFKITPGDELELV